MMSSPKSFWMLSVGVLACLWSQSARAETCGVECPKGFGCHKYEAGACASAPPCGAGEKCEAPPPCEVMTQWDCIPLSCDSDADCADFMICHAETYSECSGGAAVAPACPPNQTCPTPAPAPAPMTCTQKTTKQCTPRYALPCNAAADCGNGFSCEAPEQCSCSGSGGRGAPEPAAADAGTASGSGSASGASPEAFAPVPPQDGGAADVIAKDAGTRECECHPGDVKYCRVQKETCAVDSDCPESFACVTYAVSGGSAGCVEQKGSDGGACQPVETKSVEQKRCEPKYGGSLTKDGSFQAPTVGSPTGVSGGTSNGAPVPASDPRHESADDAGTDSAGSSDTGAAKDQASCSVRAPGAGAGGHTAGYALSFVLLALSLRRRKQH